jgi:hypothetical protein
MDTQTCNSTNRSASFLIRRRLDLRDNAFNESWPRNIWAWSFRYHDRSPLSTVNLHKGTMQRAPNQ